MKPRNQDGAFSGFSLESAVDAARERRGQGFFSAAMGLMQLAEPNRAAPRRILDDDFETRDEQPVASLN